MTQQDGHDDSRAKTMENPGNETFTYLPVPDVVARLGLYVTGAGTDVVPPGAHYPRQKHPELYDFKWSSGRVLPEYQLLCVTDGRGEFESKESGLVPVEAGMVMMLFPDVWHRYRPSPETGWTEYWISLGGDLLFQWHQRGLFDAARPLTKLRRPNKTNKLYRDVIEFVMKHPEQDAPMLTAKAMAVIASFLEQAPATSESADNDDESRGSKDPLVEESLRIIWNNSHQRVSVDMIAKQVGATRRTLERHFKKHLGRTLLQELVSCRLQRAKRMLCETHVPIKYVAYAAGFSSMPSFCKVFRREIGITPGDYRKSKTRRA
jgi:AraC-like DNA-binding protein